MKAYALPDADLIRVEYMRGNVKQSATMKRPANYDALLVVMLQRKVGQSQITGIFPVTNYAAKR